MSEKLDGRRKLVEGDYSRIRMMLSSDYTKREVAALFGVSTKFIGKIQDGYFSFNPDGSTSFTMTQEWVMPEFALTYPCSGCHYSFGSFSGLQMHFSIYTSGGSKALDCMNLL
jgi:hypothetical protein